MRPVVTVALVAANAATYAVGLSVWTYGLVPAHPTLPSMLTSMFLHASLVHLVSNMVFLVFIGTLVERKMGHLWFLALYVAAGAVGVLVHILVNQASTDPLVGASGAICGLLAVATILRPRMLVFVVMLVAINVWYAFSGTDGVVSFGDHIGGFAVGALFVMLARASESPEVTS